VVIGPFALSATFASPSTSTVPPLAHFPPCPCRRPCYRPRRSLPIFDVAPRATRRSSGLPSPEAASSPPCALFCLQLFLFSSCSTSRLTTSHIPFSSSLNAADQSSLYRRDRCNRTPLANSPIPQTLPSCQPLFACDFSSALSRKHGSGVLCRTSRASQHHRR